MSENIPHVVTPPHLVISPPSLLVPMKRQRQNDFLIPTRAKRAKRTLPNPYTLQGMLPELRILIWDVMSWHDRANVALTCHHLYLELKRHSLFVPRAWIPGPGVPPDCRRLWISLMHWAKQHGLHRSRRRPRIQWGCEDETSETGMQWTRIESNKTTWYLYIDVLGWYARSTFNMSSVSCDARVCGRGDDYAYGSTCDIKEVVEKMCSVD